MENADHHFSGIYQLTFGFSILNVGRQLCTLPENLKKIGAKMRQWESRVDQKVGLVCRHFRFSAILTKNYEDKRQNIDILLFSRPESVESDAKIAPIWKKWKNLTFCGQLWLFRKTRSAILAEFISGFSKKNYC